MVSRVVCLLLIALLLWSDLATQETPASASAPSVATAQDEGDLIDAHHVDDLPAQLVADVEDPEQNAAAPPALRGPLGRPLAAATSPAHCAQAPPDSCRRPPKGELAA